MNRIHNQTPGQVELALQVLEWITRAKRSLTVSELRHALAVELDSTDFRVDMDNLPDEDDLVSVCVGLVAVDKETGVIRLAHYTAQEFFETTHKKWFPLTETQLARVCLKYISSDGLDRPCGTDREYEERLWNNPFYSYAAKNWAQHVNNSDISRTLIHSVVQLLKDEGKMEALSQAMFSAKPGTYRGTSYPGYSQLFARDLGSLHLAAYFGLKDVMPFFLAPHCIELCDGSGTSVLSWAAMGGHLGSVQLLLDNNADPNKEDQTRKSPLLISAWKGHKLIVMALLDKGADLESVDCGGRTALSWAAAGGHLEVVRILLERRTKINARDEKGRTALLWGARNGFGAVVKILLDAGAQVDSEDADLRTPLSWAVRTPEIEEVLLHFGANPEVRNRCGRTALSFAASGGHEATTRLLLEHGSSTDVADLDEQTPLLWAAKKGHKSVVSLLLLHGSNPNHVDVDGQTPMSWAIQNEHASLVTILSYSFLETHYGSQGGSGGFKPRGAAEEAKSDAGYLEGDQITHTGGGTPTIYRNHIGGTSGVHETLDPRM